MTLPFDKREFNRTMKPLVSVAHLSLEYYNIESTLVKVCTELSDKLGSATYEQIAAAGTNETQLDTSTAAGQACDYLQRAVLHFALYQHVIYTIANITNDGITVTKSEDKTTIYKYQQDQLEEKLLQDAWFWLNRLIKYLNQNTDTFTAWKESEERLSLTALPVTIDDFSRYVGVSDETFLLYAGWIIREVYREQVLSRFPKVPTEDAEKICEASCRGAACESCYFLIQGYAAHMKEYELREMTERDVRLLTELTVCAVCYDTMARACQRLAFHALPSPIRIDINNEMGKNHAAQADTMIREKVAKQFADKADAQWQGVDAELRKRNEGLAADYPNPRKLTENDKFVV